MTDRCPTMIWPARTSADLFAVADLFRTYAASLPVDLGYQQFDDEVRGLPGAYAPPRGDLFLGGQAPDAIGCVAIRPIRQQACELKRLFVLPAGRGTGLGRALAQHAIVAAGHLGYREVWLDTLASMDRARELYGRLGFDPCEPYYGPTPPGTVFMRRRL